MGEIPYETEQGIQIQEQGISWKEQGISTRVSGNWLGEENRLLLIPFHRDRDLRKLVG